MFKVLEDTVADAEQSVGADTVIRVYGPLIERRVERLVESLIAAPDNELVGLRGRLAEVWHSLTELRRLAARKQSTDETFNKMFGRE